ncbi:hypothetical protein [Terrabacter sp. Soil810]|uniref:hypothetical protein n=1 Tax=Terrabacter sp. Soil810 TaxID=1736418 RepID=UPI00070F08EC|nr:hypothetical protein [Terrabacter sp. Soil810]KRF38701.1 hypothetical protein ASG96_14920 [Terrabacter sp. Soil810]
MAVVNGLVMVEGLPGSGRSTTARGIASWLADQQVEVEHWAEGRVDHPVDHPVGAEQVVVLETADLLALAAESPAMSQALLRAAEQHGDVWLVRQERHPDLPLALVERIVDAARGTRVPADVSTALVADRWERFGATLPRGVHVWESVLLRSPDADVVARLVEAVRPHAPALVYLDHERDAASTRQGQRRGQELAVVEALDLPTLVVPVGDGRWDDHESAVRDFVADHLGLGDRPGLTESEQVA